MRVESNRRSVAEAPAYDKIDGTDHVVRAHDFLGNRMALDGKPKIFEKCRRPHGVRRAIAGRIVGRCLD